MDCGDDAPVLNLLHIADGGRGGQTSFRRIQYLAGRHTWKQP